MKIMRPRLLISLCRGTESCLLSGCGASSHSCVISLTNIVITRAHGSLTRLLIGQLDKWSLLIGGCGPHLWGCIVITFGHRSHRQNHYNVSSSAQLSAYWNVEFMRSIWDCTKVKTCGDTKLLFLQEWNLIVNNVGEGRTHSLRGKTNITRRFLHIKCILF